MRKRIGDFLLEKKLINQRQLQDIILHSQRTGLRFGEAGVQLGFYSGQDLIDVFGADKSPDFFYLEPAYFPQTTRDLFSVDQMLEWGALPLGFKTQYRFFKSNKALNLGLLNPNDSSLVKTIERFIETKFDKSGDFGGLKIYLIVSDQFLDVMDQVFGVKRDVVVKKNPQRLAETLHFYLESIQLN